jgi:hypothetical protein
MGLAELAALVASAVLAMCAVRFVLILLPAKRAKPRDPGELGLPVAEAASKKSAHAALSRRGSGSRPKFRT